jgi:hypothetical protein
VLVAYGVVRRKKPSMHAPAQAELVDETEEAIGPAEADPTGSDVAPGTTKADDHSSEIEARTQAEPGDAILDKAASGQAQVATTGADPVAATPGGCRVGKADTEGVPAEPAPKAKKANKKDHGDLTPCEIDAGNALIKVAGTWDRAMYVIETLKNVAGG